VLLLVPGNTYDHVYWDVPGFSGRYSYARQAAEAGYAAFVVDPLGTGHSSHPVSTEVTLAALSHTMHEVVSALRDGTVGGPGFASVVYVGHSLGAETGWLEAATYHDVDALVSTGALHAFNQTTGAKYIHDVEPASADPAFAGLGLDPGYVTTVPGIRGEVFDNPDFVDPRVVAFDEATKDVGTLTESAQSVALVAAPPAASVTQGLTVPALIAVGGQDALNCGGVGGADCTDPASVAAHEDPYYPAADQPTVLVAPQAGHDVALALDAPLTNAAIDVWLWRHVRP
jgi:pimeloyl-ACP methyl ester carboxylesterase